MQYALTTHWLLDAPMECVYDALLEPQAWPRWWRYVQSVVLLRAGDADGIGAVRRYAWASRLPYRLVFDMETTALARPTFIEGIATGELNGTGCWRLAAERGATRVRYEWRVTTGKRWMTLMAPLLAPVFEWNHDQLMAEGGRGLARYLGVRLLAYAGTSTARRRATAVRERGQQPARPGRAMHRRSTMDNGATYAGSCFCGAVQFSVTGEPAAMGYCHCGSCRLWSAGPINAFTLWPPQNVKVSRGAEHIGTYNKTPQSTRSWCKLCGGHLFTQHPAWNLTDVYAAAIPQFPFKPAVHVHYQETVLPMRDGLPKMKDLPKEMGGSGATLAE